VKAPRSARDESLDFSSEREVVQAAQLVLKPRSMRTTFWSVTLSCLALVAVAACSSDPASVSTAAGAGNGTPDSNEANNETPHEQETTATGLPCDVDKVLKTKCQTCHSSPTKYGASAPLVTYADLQAPGPGASSNKKVFELVASRIHDTARPMPPSPNPMLADVDAKVIDSWIAGGAKPSGESCTSEKAGDGVKPLSCTPDLTLKGATKYAMPQGEVDQYVCIGIDVNLAKKRHVVGLAPRIDNKTILHHILLFQSPEAVSATPTPCAAFGSASWKMVAGWAPGGNNLELPPEAGLPENKGTTHWVLQLHYNNAKALAGQLDNSGYDLCTTENLRPNDAGIVAFGGTQFSIPPRATATVKCDYTLPSSFKNVKLFNASPHMHTRGTGMTTERLVGGSGTPQPVFAMPNFSFEAQANYPINVTVQPNDVMRTRCTWKNPGDTTIGFGENTGDEMCFDFMGYYPNIPDQVAFGIPLFSWVTPSSSASCTME
jgi:hypothetical protein